MLNKPKCTLSRVDPNLDVQIPHLRAQKLLPSCHSMSHEYRCRALKARIELDLCHPTSQVWRSWSAMLPHLEYDEGSCECNRGRG